MRQRAVLKGAVGNVFLSARKPGADADGVLLMGRLAPDGTRLAGIACKTMEALVMEVVEKITR